MQFVAIRTAGMGRVGSSEAVELLIAVLVGLLAVLGALFCIGFLLVEPVRNPIGENDDVPLSKCRVVACIFYNSFLTHM